PPTQAAQWATEFNLRLAQERPGSDIYAVSLHDALPISRPGGGGGGGARGEGRRVVPDLPERSPAADRSGGSRPEGDRARLGDLQDRKSTRLNSSHDQTSYAVFCLKKKTDAGIGAMEVWL